MTDLSKGPVITQAQVHIWALLGVNLPSFVFPVSAKSEETRCSSPHIPPFVCDFSRWLSAGRSSLSERRRMSEKTLGGQAFKNISLINKPSKVLVMPCVSLHRLQSTII